MKFFVLLCAVFIATTVYADEVEANTEIEEVFREEYCNTQNKTAKEECSSFRCNKDNSKIIGVGCAEARCSGKPVGFKGDPSKPYPDCCMVPICEDNSSD